MQKSEKITYQNFILLLLLLALQHGFVLVSVTSLHPCILPFGFSPEMEANFFICRAILFMHRLR